MIQEKKALKAYQRVTGKPANGHADKLNEYAAVKSPHELLIEVKRRSSRE